jgi:hypothetical protein
MAQVQEISTTEDEILYCTVHPDRETTLRCNKCGRPMCPECAVQTSVGYRCKECVRGIQDAYYTATQNDYIAIFAVSLILTGIGAAIFAAINLGILFTFILALPIGGGIGELALRFTSKRRGRQSANIAAAGAVVGGLVGVLVQIFMRYGAQLSQLDGSQMVDAIFQLLTRDLSALLFIGLAAAAVYGRYKLRS